MFKNCSACKTKHLPPYGGYCKLSKSTSMSVAENILARESPEYLDYLEKELAAAKSEQKSQDGALQTILTRLDLAHDHPFITYTTPTKRIFPPLRSYIPRQECNFMRRGGGRGRGRTGNDISCASNCVWAKQSLNHP